MGDEWQRISLLGADSNTHRLALANPSRVRAESRPAQLLWAEVSGILVALPQVALLMCTQFRHHRLLILSLGLLHKLLNPC